MTEQEYIDKINWLEKTLTQYIDQYRIILQAYKESQAITCPVCRQFYYQARDLQKEVEALTLLVGRERNSNVQLD